MRRTTNAWPCSAIRFARGFSSDPGIVGKSVNLNGINGIPTEVIGVTPLAFFGTDQGVSPDITIPLDYPAQYANVSGDGKTQKRCERQASASGGRCCFAEGARIDAPRLGQLSREGSGRSTDAARAAGARWTEA